MGCLAPVTALLVEIQLEELTLFWQYIYVIHEHLCRPRRRTHYVMLLRQMMC